MPIMICVGSFVNGNVKTYVPAVGIGTLCISVPPMVKSNCWLGNTAAPVIVTDTVPAVMVVYASLTLPFGGMLNEANEAGVPVAVPSTTLVIVYP